jgi:TetR/AcrR family transcriptional regulator, transcriptional repressor for nem operon
MASARHIRQNQKRPATRKGQQTRRRIVEAAATLMLTNGVGRTTVDEVIEAAGVGKSQMYHYFTGKNDLVEAVIAYQTAQVLSPKGPHLAPLDSWEAWQQWRDAVVQLQAGVGCIGGCPLGSLASELADIHEGARRQLTHSFDRWQAMFQAGIEAMRERRLIAEDADPESLAVMILASLEGGLLLCQMRKSTAPLEQALDGAIRQLHCYAIT